MHTEMPCDVVELERLGHFFGAIHNTQSSGILWMLHVGVRMWGWTDNETPASLTHPATT